MLLLFIVSYISGCVHGLVGTLPNIENPEESAEIYVIRTKSMVARLATYKITFDSEELIAIKAGDYAKFKTNAGEYNREHTIGVKLRDLMIKGEIVKNLKKINIYCEPQGKYYIVVSPGWKSANIKQVDEKEGLELISQSKYLQL